jgi:glutamate--cysteine ligase
MTDVLEKCLGLLSRTGAPSIHSGLKGIEKESLRIDDSGYIARTPHPTALGSALTNRYITTDYSEALVEFVTPPVGSAWEAIQFLCDIHQFTYDRIGAEQLWAFSMPCMIRSDDDIPVARFGDSNVGRMKSIYREGLGHRYGKYMQAISGVHFNYSLPESFWGGWQEALKAEGSPDDFRSASYLGVVRNVRRLDWLLLYLFGASPAVCNSFLRGVAAHLEPFDENTGFGEHATSLRMSDLGYHNASQAAMLVSANSLQEYVADLSHAMRTPHPPYEEIGVEVDGEYRQLNANLLQIENEYYSTIRPKRVAHSGERPTAALLRGGIEYVELRALDVSPFDPVGINQRRVKFLEAFLLYCMFEASPPIDSAEQTAIDANRAAAARRGREPGLRLRRNDAEISLAKWAGEVLDRMAPICELLDLGPESGYTQALSAMRDRVDDAGQTPSARMLSELTDLGRPFFPYAMDIARDYRSYFIALASEHNASLRRLETEARESIERQKEIEAADDMDFDVYLSKYYS